MKLIEGMKLIKELKEKADDLRKKIALHCAHLSIETPVYGSEQTKTVAEWLQGHESVVQEIGALMVRVSKSNLATNVTIKIGDKEVTKTITEWIARRKVLCALDLTAWGLVGDRGLKEGAINSTQGAAETRVTIVRHYDPKIRDAKVSMYKVEPSLIDRTLEVVNATTDLMA